MHLLLVAPFILLALLPSVVAAAVESGRAAAGFAFFSPPPSRRRFSANRAVRETTAPRPPVGPADRLRHTVVSAPRSCGAAALRSAAKDDIGFIDGSGDDASIEARGAGGGRHRVGFLGFGTIARSIASGLFDHPAGRSLLRPPVRITRRSRNISSDFAASYPTDRVALCDSNQEVVDESEVVFLCVLPEQVPDVVKSVEWDVERHVLVSLASTTTLEELREWSGLAGDRVFRMICLPRVAKADSVSLVCPVPSNLNDSNSQASSDHPLLSICHALGGCVPCSTQDDFRTLTTITGLMGPLYGIMRRNVRWLASKGVPEEDAGKFVSGMYAGMAGDALDRSDAAAEEGGGGTYLDELIEEQTKGGLNEGALRCIEGAGVLDAYDCAMDEVLDRLEGGNEGSGSMT